VYSVELPQASISFTNGAEATLIGAAVPEPAALIHPLPLFVVTVYAPPAVTVMEVVVAPVLHNNVPLAVVDKVELPQASISLTVGADGTLSGAAVPDPDALVQPLPLVVVTVYAPLAVTVIDVVVSPVLHNKLPLAVVDNVELPQASISSLTDGADG
jgi:hypothetical protein